MNPFVKNAFLLIMTISLAYSCQCNRDNKSAGTKMKKSEIRKEVADMIYPLPTSYEVAAMLNEIEASYIFGITNDSKNVEKYFSPKQQALNLGIYAADLAYANTYNLKQETYAYLDALKTLIRSLDMAPVIDEETIRAIEVNEDNKDQLVKVITNLFYRTYTFLQDNNKAELSYLFLTGTWIEGMHLTLNISENTFDNLEIVKVIVNQEKSLNKLIEIMAPVKDHELTKDIFASLQQISAIYAEGDGAGSLTRKQLEKLASINEGLRAEFVK